jgi:hypothetical protein
MGVGVSWPAGADEVIKADITAAAAYLTPAGGAVVTSVAPCGIGDRGQGLLGFTTSFGFGKKLERIVADPHVALAYHAREHGFSASPAFVLAQGTASVDLTPSRQRDKNTLLVLNGLLAKYGMWQARRHGAAGQLQRLAAARAVAGAGGDGRPPPG